MGCMSWHCIQSRVSCPLVIRQECFQTQVIFASLPGVAAALSLPYSWCCKATEHAALCQKADGSMASSMPSSVCSQHYAQNKKTLPLEMLALLCSMDIQGSLLAAGGKNGHAAVFGIQQATVCCTAANYPTLQLLSLVKTCGGHLYPALACTWLNRAVMSHAKLSVVMLGENLFCMPHCRDGSLIGRLIPKPEAGLHAWFGLSHSPL